MTSSLRKKEALTAWLFITPYLIGFTLFHFLPVLLSAVLSLTDMRYISMIDKTHLIGLGNYIEMSRDPEFWNAFRNSIVYSVCFVPFVMAAGLLLAVLVNQKIHFRNGIRAMIFMPYVSNMVAIAIVWSILLDPVDGIVNQTLRALGFTNAPMWLMGSKTALYSVVMIAVWREVGLQFVTYLAALQEVPTELKEAAQIDGAGRFQQFIYVTLPLIRNTTFLLTITSIITSLKNFTIIQVLTAGDREILLRCCLSTLLIRLLRPRGWDMPVPRPWSCLFWLWELLLFSGLAKTAAKSIRRGHRYETK